MRRFTQTFVLGAQAPKKYYVHNDIFRYQDFGYSDEEEGEPEGVEGALIEVAEREGEEGVRSEPEEEEQQNQPQHITAPISGSEQHTVILTQPPIAGQPLYYPPPPPQHVMTPVINGSVHEDASLINQQQQQQPSIPLPQQPVQTQQPQYVEPVVQEQFSQETETTSATEPQQVTEDEHSQSVESIEQTETEKFSTPTAEIVQESSPANTSNSGPKTYANLVKSFASSQATLTNTQPQKMSMSPVSFISNFYLTNFEID